MFSTKSYHLSSTTFAKITKIESLSHHLLDYANYYLNPYCFNIVFQYNIIFHLSIIISDQDNAFFHDLGLLLILSLKIEPLPTIGPYQPVNPHVVDVERAPMLRLVVVAMISTLSFAVVRNP